MHWSDSKNEIPLSEIICYLLRLLTFAIQLFLMRWEFLKGQQTSAVQSLFWFFLFIADIPQLHQYSIQAQEGYIYFDKRRLVAFSVSFVFICIQMIATLFVDKNSTETSRNGAHSVGKPNPEASSCFWSQLFFFWMTWDILRAFRKTVQVEDLYDLCKADSCSSLVPDFFKKFSDTSSQSSHLNETHSETKSGDLSSGDNASSDNASRDNAFGDNASSDNAPGPKVSSDDASVGNASSDNDHIQYISHISEHINQAFTNNENIETGLKQTDHIQESHGTSSVSNGELRTVIAVPKKSTLNAATSTATDTGYVNEAYLNNEESNASSNATTGHTKDRIFRKKRSFLWALALSTGWPALIGTILQTFSIALQVLSPQVLGVLITFIETGDPHTWKGLVLAAVLYALQTVVSVLRHNNFLLTWLAGIRVRSVVNAIVYRKALRLSGSVRKTTTVGEIVNLMSVDAQKLQDAFTFCILLYQVPVLIIISVILIFYTVGVAAFTGLVVLLVIVPANGLYVANKTKQLQSEQMNAKDKRIKTLHEALSAIKILKFYAWEPSFESTIQETRDKELKTLKAINIIAAISSMFWFICPYLVSLAIFATFVLISEENLLTTEKAFVTLSYINIFNFTLSKLHIAVGALGQGIASNKRISEFLDLPEIEDNYVDRYSGVPGCIEISQGTLSWESNIETLRNINLKIAPGSLVAIVGPVGSGKSSLLCALLGEMQKVNGFVKVNGSIAYVPQQAWIKNATMRNNILFNKPYNRSFYYEVIEVCCLRPDLQVLPGGDKTEIGEKGINLSGGQKQRISLARAIYQNEDIYLLDDPLSAVDAHVGKDLFNGVIGPCGILRTKTRIFVTNSMAYLPQSDFVVYLKDGVVLESGTFQELQERNGPFTQFMQNVHLDDDGKGKRGKRDRLESESCDIDLDDTSVNYLSPTLAKLPLGFADDLRSPRRRSSDEAQTSITRNSDVKVKFHRRMSKGSFTAFMRRMSVASIGHSSKLVIAENTQKGRVKLGVIRSYIQAGGWKFLWLTVVCYIVFIASQILTNIWLSDWTNENDHWKEDGQPSDTSAKLAVYFILGFFQALSICVVLLATAFGVVSSSQTLHSNLLSKILHAPMSFFDTTPLGRILNRFSQDIDTLDSRLPVLLRGWLFCISPLIATFFFICYTTPIFLVVALPIVALYIAIQRLYIMYAGQLKRIESVLRSPIYAHFDESIAGAVSIRAYCRQEEYIQLCDEFVDCIQKPWYCICVAQRWLGIAMEFLGGMVVFFSTLFAVLQRDSLTAGLVALSVSYSLQVTTHMNALVRRGTELETYMVSVERVDEYCDIKSEEPWNYPDNEPTPDWPTEGQIELDKFSTKFRHDLDPVLKLVSFIIKPGEKVGVVGRTGAGKSSLTLALFRIIEASNGRILIDGIDTSEIGLHDLRKKLAIIPQDPVLFSGDLRFNLDPFEEYTDAEIWLALEQAHLKTFIASQREGLQYPCGENGSALSVGQRQLVCLARALLKKSRILVLDEATAAVDLEMDILIQNTIRSEFKDSTILTVAHRLHTVMDYDRIMVLSEGDVIELDTPRNLLHNKDSVFHELAKEAGITVSHSIYAERL